MAVPFLINDSPIGVLNAEHSRIHAFDDINKRRLFSLFSSRASILIRERIERDQAQRREEEERQRALVAQLDAQMGKLAQAIAHHVRGQTGLMRSDIVDMMDELEAGTIDLTPELLERRLTQMLSGADGIIKLVDGLFLPYRSGQTEIMPVDDLLSEVLNVCGEVASGRLIPLCPKSRSRREALLPISPS